MSMGTPDLTLQECCERWGVSSRNSVKARAAALGVELRRESSTRTVWPRDEVPLGDELDQHLKTGGTLRDFPGALPQPQQQARPLAANPSLPAVTAGSDAMAMAMLQLLQQQAPQQPSALARARGMAAAADERLPLTTAELAELVGIDAEELETIKAGSSLYGFRLKRVGNAPRKKGAPDRRAWLLERFDADSEPVSAVTSLAPVTPQEAPARAPGFLARLAPAIDAQATVLGRLELPRW
jgi:hypothetical protein